MVYWFAMGFSPLLLVYQYTIGKSCVQLIQLRQSAMDPRMLQQMGGAQNMSSSPCFGIVWLGMAGYGWVLVIQN